MMKRQIGWACALVLMAAGAAHAQTAGTVTLTASPTSGTGSVTPKLTWSTSPAATSCTASGGWSGTKAASGSQTQTAITASKSYTLTCTWGGSGSATVNWTAPTTNTDGSKLTDVASYRVVYGTSSSSLTKSKTITDASARSTSVGSLTPATWYFAVRTVNSQGAESNNSNVGSKVIKGASAAKTVNVSVTSASRSLTTKAYNVWDVKRKSDGTLALNIVVGKIALGKPCYTWYKVGSKHYVISKSDITKMYYTPISTNLVVNCVGD